MPRTPASRPRSHKPSSKAEARAPRRSLPPLDPLRYAPSAARPVRVKARPMAQQMDIQPHSHAWAQLVFSLSGAVRVSTASSTFIVPPSRAVWIPPGVQHAVTAVELADLRTCYLQEQLLTGADWRASRVLEVSPLLRELAVELSQAPADGAPTRREALLSELLVDELKRARSLPLGVSLPQDARLRRLCEAMLDAPGRHASLQDWAQEVGASARTLTRLFRSELGTSFARWREQLLLAQALAMAARGRPINVIASELGYGSASAFSAMVTRTVGMSPRRFFAAA
jgi:AraC-like DNA-binding protein/mannose-6-phosphate isomerase-like protein (cupin superfamily)